MNPRVCFVVFFLHGLLQPIDTNIAWGVRSSSSPREALLFLSVWQSNRPWGTLYRQKWIEDTSSWFGCTMETRRTRSAWSFRFQQHKWFSDNIYKSDTPKVVMANTLLMETSNEALFIIRVNLKSHWNLWRFTNLREISLRVGMSRPRCSPSGMDLARWVRMASPTSGSSARTGPRWCPPTFIGWMQP